MAAKQTKSSKSERPEAQNPLILRAHRLMDAFAKSDDERDFFIDRQEGFLIYVDLDKTEPELETLEDELKKNADRYCLIPKLSFYETKKIMEGFVNEKVYDIDTKEKLLDIIQSKEARENFLEFIQDHHSEQEKWQQFYQERSRIRIIEWLRQNHFHFVFEEDLDLPRPLIEKVKQSLFQPKVGKDIQTARKALVAKAKTYYSNEALNPRPKRGRPPKQAAKPEIEPQVTTDIYTTVTTNVRPFLYIPDLHGSISTFSSKFESEEGRPNPLLGDQESLQQKLASLRTLSSRWLGPEGSKDIDFDADDEDEDEDEEFEKAPKKPKSKTPPPKKAAPKPKVKQKTPPKAPEKTKVKPKRIIMPRDNQKQTKNKVLKKLTPKKK